MRFDPVTRNDNLFKNYKAWFSLATQAQAQTQAQEKGNFFDTLRLRLRLSLPRWTVFTMK